MFSIPTPTKKAVAVVIFRVCYLSGITRPYSSHENTAGNFQTHLPGYRIGTVCSGVTATSENIARMLKNFNDKATCLLITVYNPQRRKGLKDGLHEGHVTRPPSISFPPSPALATLFALTCSVTTESINRELCVYVQNVTENSVAIIHWSTNHGTRHAEQMKTYGSCDDDTTIRRDGHSWRVSVNVVYPPSQTEREQRAFGP